MLHEKKACETRKTGDEEMCMEPIVGDEESGMTDSWSPFTVSLHSTFLFLSASW